MSTRSRLVIFDLDGTLADSAPDISRALNKVLGTSDGGRQVADLEVKSLVGDGARTTIERAMALCGLEASHSADEYLGAYVKELADVRLTRLFPGAREALDGLRGDGHLLAVCTNKVRAATDSVLCALGIADLFQLVVACDETPKPKPDPGHVRQILDLLKIRPEDAIYVGDSAHDIAAARGAGVANVAVVFGYSAVPAEQLGADYVLDDFTGLLSLVRSAFRKSSGQ
jgi:phosphoglycolate phosphatase